MFDHIRANGVRALAAFMPIWQGCKSIDATLHAALSVGIQRDLESIVGDFFADFFPEG